MAVVMGKVEWGLTSNRIVFYSEESRPSLTARWQNSAKTIPCFAAWLARMSQFLEAANVDEVLLNVSTETATQKW